MTHAPYTEINEPWPKYERGWWVRVSSICREAVPQAISSLSQNDFLKSRPMALTRLGLINERKGLRYCIQFGAGGPFEWHHKDALTLATRSQVAYMEGTA